VRLELSRGEAYAIAERLAGTVLGDELGDFLRASEHSDALVIDPKAADAD
jgi:hypothetical protein